MILTDHFTLEEMTITQSGLENVPDDAHIRSLKALCVSILEPIRDNFKQPVIVTSAFRSPEVNRAAGGENDSQHLRGEAADIHINGVANAIVWQWIVDNLPFDQVIAEKLSRKNGAAGWIHVSYAPANRKSDISFLGNGVYVNGLEFID
jgi:zinc D-Ala-D-Ala carboxypeptidase